MHHRIICLEFNIVSGAHANDDEIPAIYEYDINVEPGHVLTKEPRNHLLMLIQEQLRFIMCFVNLVNKN